MNKVVQIGNIVPDSPNFSNPQRGRVYSIDGIAPTLNTCGGGGLEPKILVRNFNDYINNKHKRGKNGDMICV